MRRRRKAASFLVPPLSKPSLADSPSAASLPPVSGLSPLDPLIKIINIVALLIIPLLAKGG